MIAYIKDGEATEEGVWDTNIFGKSVEQIVEDGMQAKISQMTEDCQMKTSGIRCRKLLMTVMAE